MRKSREIQLTIKQANILFRAKLRVIEIDRYQTFTQLYTLVHRKLLKTNGSIFSITEAGKLALLMGYYQY